jgi:hypothetical protein
MAAGETAGPSTSLRYGRDDNSVETGIDATEQSWTPQQNCHRPDRKWRDRSVAKWRDLRFSPSRKPCNLSHPSSLVIPTGA